ncbi:hypothetical protein EDB80DRAFT_675123 [Ilyonectria destructans]|nr:hypothetical protein EDB80DRAFT_675123 [Ilyonectria destructans]
MAQQASETIHHRTPHIRTSYIIHDTDTITITDTVKVRKTQSTPPNSSRPSFHSTLKVSVTSKTSPPLSTTVVWLAYPCLVAAAALHDVSILSILPVLLHRRRGNPHHGRSAEPGFGMPPAHAHALMLSSCSIAHCGCSGRELRDSAQIILAILFSLNSPLHCPQSASSDRHRLGHPRSPRSSPPYVVEPWLQLAAASLSPGVNGLRGWTWSWASGGAKSANARYTPDKGKTPGRRRLGHEVGFGKEPEASDSSESSQGHGICWSCWNPVTHFGARSIPRSTGR